MPCSVSSLSTWSVSHSRASGLPRLSSPPAVPPRSHSGWFSDSHVPAVHALRLEPDDGLDALGVGVVADRPQAAGEAVRVDLPGAGLRPARLVPVPAGVHPPVVERQPLLEVAVDEQLLVGAVGVDHLAELVRAARGQLHGRQLAAGPGQVVGEHPAPPDVLRARSSRRARTAARSAACGPPRRGAA